jgi:hypothetical protein
MTDTATDMTREHYQRPKVREIICKFAMPGDGTWRALNGGFHRWYRHSVDGQARLLNATEDYDKTTDVYRTLYQTLNVFDPSLWMVARPKEEITSDNPLGTPADTVAYTLGTDIDKGRGCNIEDPEIRQAVEAAAQFLVDYLKMSGIHESVWVLFSGGGIYVEIHHEICRPVSSAPEDRAVFFEELTDRYNRLIAWVAEDFFKIHPEYIGKVKYDALNNSKRVFKCILSIHKKKPYAVTPLNRDLIRIDFERARIPLMADMLSEAMDWYSTYDPAEHEALLTLLNQFKEPEAEKQLKSDFKEIWRSSSKVDEKHFPPCIKHIVDSANPGEGKTRFTAVLSTFLYQMGWEDEEAWDLVKTVSDRNGLEHPDYVFYSCFGRISCPACKTIQEDGAGYPHLGLKGLGACQQAEECDRWPGDYALTHVLNDGQGSSYEGAEIEGLIFAENPRLTLDLEKDNAIMRYIEYGKSTCDAYMEYHYGAALSLLSISINRNITLKLKQGDVFPNIWTFLLGRSTISRKTAAISKAQKFADDLFPYVALPQSYSPEGLVEELSEIPRGYLFKDEAGAMLAAMAKNYMLEMRDLYCILYDCQSYKRKLRSGQRKEKRTFDIQNPFINILTATTPETFREYTSLLDLTSGWLLRFIYFYPNYKKDWMAFKPAGDEDFALYGEVLGRLSRIKGMFYSRETPIEIAFNQEAWDYYQTWQETREIELQDTTDAIELALWGRLSFYALKLAILFTVARADYQEGMQVSLDHVKEACRQVDEYFLPVGKLVAEEVAREETTNLQNKILGTLSRAGGRILRKNLLKALHATLRDVHDALSALQESEEISVIEEKGKGKPAFWVVLNKKEVREKSNIEKSQKSHSRNNRNSRKNSDDNTCSNETIATNATNAIKGTIESDLQRAEEQRCEKQSHDWEQAAKYTVKQPKSYSEMAGSVPFDTSSPEAVKICSSFRFQLMKGIAPRIDFLVKDTGLSEAVIQAYLNSASWVRKNDSSPAGIVVYFPVEASA